MELVVVRCDCGNPRAHRKLESPDGEQSRGFFSIDSGKELLAKLIAKGNIEQTDEETAATTQEIESCGLPMTDELASEQFLKDTAEVFVNFPPANHRKMLDMAIEDGVISTEEAEKILAMVSAPTTPVVES
ncbi:MAG: hypothetical protein UW46_C0004G0049 [Candidatus Yanofskybacteria bacterium GW2011_GWF1_44_227]|uniref:Uncharacterized protein n=1 Tax=Candidatus Yanofskybacteria bacterium GW2011_GWE2_40_11 TaxID=1619033 RepID=A0A0G0T0B9_9BACT|nr:MAG: hypothetical protein UT75_C0007G0023 [Candidatus Yanofskybacteria bacterium GW2011_GWE2_40_11]KKT15629.1 MAG: hypothetical protein UV97_C0004G0045 [Candidatus Yanofskybacteria bacterium GW2011_GWF2_43_596]KKT53322.1 MAG: hypothetical protein UW46_C0004G0049 [Candidatus Yanofskybacteria bacterium GW2011_GWF1_44_227]OGN35952.1 MAG: hypothetical protein A2207_02740 [Candidatus Yanofskybacteria bacterium RIFOXYA1_FULL_44_17]OGN36446.1 MAG: hypothetical protein A2241_01745 [Candidatus Yanofs